MGNLNNLLDFPKENRLIYDWLSFTTRKHNVQQLIALLGLNECPWCKVKGSHGYQNRLYYNGISIHYNDEDIDWEIHYNTQDIYISQMKSDGFIWLEMSGQGCRAFETYGTGNYEMLLELARKDSDNIHVTRIDIAFDDMTGIFDIDKVCDATRKENFTARTSNYQCIYSNKGNAVYFGSRQSNVFIRIYDKAAERGYDNKELHWIRCELQLKDLNAQNSVHKAQFYTLKELYLGIINNYLCFRDPSEDSNKRRWDISDWWKKFIEGAEKISVYSKPGVIYNLEACERYVMTQPLGALKTLLIIYGEEKFTKILDDAPLPKNPKYQRLIAEELARINLLSEKELGASS